MLPTLAVVTGVMTLFVFVLKWDKYLTFIPASVIHGFTLGVAFIIALTQLNNALGLTGMTPHESQLANIMESLRHLAFADGPTVLVFLAGLAFLFGWMRLVPRFPGAIILAAAGIGLGYATSENLIPLSLQTLFTKYGDIDATLFLMPALPSLETFRGGFMVTAAATTAIIVIETLISAKIADGMTKTKFDRRKEVLGVGLANIAAGVMGGLPGNGVFARTALNVKSGATHQASGIINAIIVGVISLLLLPQFKFLPLAVVAAILVHTAYRLVHRQDFAHLYEHDKTSFALSMAVAAITVLQDAILGILIGAVAALLVFVNKLAQGQAEVTVNEKGSITARLTFASFRRHKEHGEVLVYRFAGPLTYLNSLPHLEALQRVKEPHSVILALRNLHFLDVDGLDALEEMVEMLEQRGIRVGFSGVGELLLPMLGKSPVYKRKVKEGLVYESTSIAVKAMEKAG